MKCTKCGKPTNGSMKDGHDNPFCSEICYRAYYESPDQLKLPLQGDPGDEDDYPLKLDLE